MLRKAIFISLMFTIPAVPLSAREMQDVINTINKAEAILKTLDENKELSRFIPFDIYNEAVLNIIYARNLVEEKKIAPAYFYSTASLIKMEAARTIAYSRKTRYQILELKKGSGKTPDAIIEANLLKKGSTYRIQFFDKQLFQKKKRKVVYRLNNDAQQKLDKIIQVLKTFPSSMIKVVGHTSSFDYKKYSKTKAAIVANYLKDKGISESRIEVIGMGNNEVTYTYLGYRRVSRIEIIITGIK